MRNPDRPAEAPVIDWKSGEVLPDGAPTIRTTTMPKDANPSGDIFGGWLLAQMDLAAASLATRRAQGRCATVAVEAMSFLSPVLVGDEVSLYTRLVGEGRSSMRIAVEAWRRRRDSEESVKVTEGLFVLVAIDAERRPRSLPPQPKVKV
jgi:acyl-CoA thioesterase YciA